MAKKNGVKADIEANWLKAKNFIPASNEIIIYEPDNKIDFYRVKIGDGVRNVTDLEFVTAEAPIWQSF